MRRFHWTPELSPLRSDPPVAFAKLRFQETDAVSGAGIFLLQTVESINDCKTKVTTSQTGTLVEPTNGWITGAKKGKRNFNHGRKNAFNICRCGNTVLKSSSSTLA